MSPMSQHTLTRTDVSFPFLFCKAFSSLWPLPQSMMADGSLGPCPHCLVQHWRQNHRMVGVGRDLCGSPSPTPLPKQGLLQQAAQDLEMGSFILEEEDLHRENCM